MPRSFQVTAHSSLHEQDVDCIYCHADIVLHEYVTTCPTCRSPHHVECWKSNGSRCATFGCDFAEVLVPTPSARSSEAAASNSGRDMASAGSGRSSAAGPTFAEDFQRWGNYFNLFILGGTLLFLLFTTIFWPPANRSLPRPDAAVTRVNSVAKIDSVEIATRVASYTPTPTRVVPRWQVTPASRPVPVLIDNIIVGTTRYRIMQTWVVGPDFGDLQADSEYVFLRISVQNLSSEPVRYQPPRLIDAREQIYEVVEDSMRYFPLDSVCSRKILLTDAEHFCMMVFDVDVGAAGQLNVIFDELRSIDGDGERKIVPLPRELRKLGVP